MSERAPEEQEAWTTMPGGLQRNPDHIMKPADPQAEHSTTSGDMETSPWEVEPSPRIPRPVNRYIQQEALRGFSPPPGVTGENLCLPVSFYSLIEAMGYQDLYARDPLRFIESVNGLTRKRKGQGWSRPAVSDAAMMTFKGMPVVSWQFGKNTLESLSSDNLMRMHDTGYLHTQEEEDYFRDHIVGPDPNVGRDISEIVNDGTPVLVTVKAGFAANETDDHAVIIDGWDENGVHIVDPDGRYEGDGIYSSDYVREYLTGGCTVILPSFR